MVFAKHKQAKDDLQKQFHDRDVHRTYRALVEGQPSTSTGTVREAWLMEDKHLNVKAVNKSHPKGKEAVSHYHVLETNDGTAHVEKLPSRPADDTRFAWQCNTSDLLLWGMSVHGATSNPHQRIMLHAFALEFLHPETDDPVRFEAPLPAAFSLNLVNVEVHGQTVGAFVDIELTNAFGSAASKAASKGLNNTNIC